MSKCFAAVSDGSKAFCITGKTGGNCLTEKTERTRIGAVLIFALAALICIWVTPHGFDTTDTGNLLMQYTADVSEENPIGIATYLTVAVGRVICRLLPGGELLVLSLLAWLLFAAQGAMVWDMTRACGAPLLRAALIVCGIFMNKFFDLLGYNNWSMLCFIALLWSLWRALSKACLRWFCIAGVIAGLSVGFRFPNILQWSMLLGILWHGLWTQRFAEAIRRSVLFLSCALLTLAAVYGSYVLRFGAQPLLRTFDKMGDLSSGKQTAGGYGVTAMLFRLFEGLTQGFAAVCAAALLCALAGWLLSIFLRRPSGGRSACSILPGAAGALAGLILLVRIAPQKGIDALTGRYPSLCLFAAATLAVSLTAAFVFAKRDILFSTLCVFAVGMVLIVTLGTNNGVLFFMMGMPYSLTVAGMALIRLYRLSAPGNWLRMSGTALGACLLTALIPLAAGNMITYEYLDAPAAQTTVKCDVPGMEGMRTTRQRSAAYEEFSQIMAPYRDRELILYGSFPIGYWITGMQPALDQAWLDLDSYPAEKMETALAGLEQEQRWPVIAFSYTWGPDYIYAPEKWQLLEAFADKNGYEEVYRSEQFVVYVHPE